ncbi:MAG: hypothetical protein HXX17_13465 [Geobacteraceae bacterium]|nr:hypothetical protein [Geobacteraceae bacterium]
MTKSEIIGRIESERKQGECFIKFYKTGHTLVDIDLIDAFIAKRDQSGEIDEFELLDMEQTWLALIELDPDRLIRSGKSANEVIEWIWSDSGGNEKKTIFPFTPDGIMQIINDEFFA